MSCPQTESIPTAAGVGGPAKGLKIVRRSPADRKTIARPPDAHLQSGEVGGITRYV